MEESMRKSRYIRRSESQWMMMKQSKRFHFILPRGLPERWKAYQKSTIRQTVLNLGNVYE